jgi:hypothetical protein
MRWERSNMHFWKNIHHIQRVHHAQEQMFPEIQIKHIIL